MSAVGALPRSGALCFGDSGSPLFLGGSNIQVALHHDAPGDCSGLAYTQRLDTPAEQEFLAPFLSSAPRPTATPPLRTSPTSPPSPATECRRMFGVPDYLVRVAVADTAAYEPSP